MKRVLLSVAAATILASPLDAQLTSVNGANACFRDVSSGTAFHSAGACASNTTYWSTPGSPSNNDDYFAFERPSNPGAQGGSSTSITFAPNNLSNVFNLGWFRFDNQSNTGATATATLRSSCISTATRRPPTSRTTC